MSEKDKIKFLHQPNLFSKKDKVVKIEKKLLPQSVVTKKILNEFPDKFKKEPVKIDGKMFNLSNPKDLSAQEKTTEALVVLFLRFLAIESKGIYLEDNYVNIELPYLQFIPKTIRQIIESIDKISEQELDLRSELELVRKTFRKEAAYGGSFIFFLEAVKRGVPFYNLERRKVFQLGQASRAVRCFGAGAKNYGFATSLIKNKHTFKRFISRLDLPFPKGEKVHSIDQAEKVAQSIGYPVCLKPLKGTTGQAVYPDVADKKRLKELIKLEELSFPFLVEKSLAGSEYRILCFNKKVIAVTNREPASIVGDGNHTIKELVDIENKKRFFSHFQHEIKIPKNINEILSKQNLRLDSTPKKGKRVYIRNNSNISTGGRAIDCTKEIHPTIKKAAEKIATCLNIQMVGIDLITDNINSPLSNESGFIEANPLPGIDLHHHPDEGKSQDVAGYILNHYIQEHSNFRIPIIAFYNSTRIVRQIIQDLPEDLGVFSPALSKELEKVNLDSSQFATIVNTSYKKALFDLEDQVVIENGLYFDEIDLLFLQEDFENKQDNDVQDFLISLSKNTFYLNEKTSKKDILNKILKIS